MHLSSLSNIELEATCFVFDANRCVCNVKWTCQGFLQGSGQGRGETVQGVTFKFNRGP